MKLFGVISPADLAAAALFALCWIAYEPVLRRLTRGQPATINTHMAVIRTAWMRSMARREARFLDGQLLGHAITSATFFASSNLIVIAAAAGALFGGDRVLRSVQVAPLVAGAPQLLLKIKLALVVAVLGRSLLSFIWSIRQMNYCLAAIGAAPDPSSPPERLKAYGEAAGEVLNPALSTFNSGVRGYYFALAAGAWLLGPVAFALITLLAVGLLAWRQFSSRSAVGVRKLRALLEESEP
jgi:uncharacterized membrane protein